MRHAIWIVLFAAACESKMTPDRCVAIMSRVTACMDPDVKTIPAHVEPDEMFVELCTDDEMMRFARESERCLESSTCAELHACYKAPKLGDLVHALK